MEDTDAMELTAALRWALDTSSDPATASADWLAMDIDGAHPSAVDLIKSADAPLPNLEKAKSVYKTLRIVGETSADRRIGARLYAASIAAAMVRHGRRISRQSDAALIRAFESLLDDDGMDDGLRLLAGQALSMLTDGSAPPYEGR